MPKPDPSGRLGISKERMDQFLKVARALKTIRDKRLFREDYRSFDAYCRAKLGKSGEEIERMLAEADLELQVRKAKPGLQ